MKQLIYKGGALLATIHLSSIKNVNSLQERLVLAETLNQRVVQKVHAKLKDQPGTDGSDSSMLGTDYSNQQESSNGSGDGQGDQKVPQNSQATQLVATSKQQEQLEDELTQSHASGDMDSGDVLAYSGEISGQSAAQSNDLIEDSELQQPIAAAAAPTPKPAPAPKPAPPKPVAQTPSPPKPQPVQPPILKVFAQNIQPITVYSEVVQPPQQPTDHQLRIDANHEQQMQTKRDLQKVQENLAKEEEEEKRLQKLDEDGQQEIEQEEKEVKLIEDKKEKVRLAQENLKKTKERIEQLKKSKEKVAAGSVGVNKKEGEAVATASKSVHNLTSTANSTANITVPAKPSVSNMTKSVAAHATTATLVELKSKEVGPKMTPTTSTPAPPLIPSPSTTTTPQQALSASIQAKIAAIKAHTAELKKQTEHDKFITSNLKKMQESSTTTDKDSKTTDEKKSGAATENAAIPTPTAAGQPASAKELKPQQTEDQQKASMTPTSSGKRAGDSKVLEGDKNQSTKGEIDLDSVSGNAGRQGSVKNGSKNEKAAVNSTQQQIDYSQKNASSHSNFTNKHFEAAKLPQQQVKQVQPDQKKQNASSSVSKQTNLSSPNSATVVQSSKSNSTNQNNSLNQNGKNKSKMTTATSVNGMKGIAGNNSKAAQPTKLDNNKAQLSIKPTKKVKGKIVQSAVQKPVQVLAKPLVRSKPALRLKPSLPSRKLLSPKASTLFKPSMISHTKGTSDFSLDSLQEAADQVGQLSNMATLPPNPSAATSEDDGAQGEDIDATPEQLQKLRAVMDSDTTSAIVEGLAQADPQAIMQKEKEENDRAAAEAAKDLDDDYGESPAGSAAAAAAAEQSDDGDQVVPVVKNEQHLDKLSSLETTLHSTSIHKLSRSPKDLDSLIGASTVLEMSDGDTEYLKQYSERVAMEADQSDQQQKDEEKMKEELKQAQIRDKLAKEQGQDFSVENARELAAKLNAQLDIGVAQAEAKKVQADLAYDAVIQKRHGKPTPAPQKKSRIKK